MPIYDCELNEPMIASRLLRSTAPGALPFPRFNGWAGRLVDATGKGVPLLVTRCNTETGHVEGYREGEDGKYRVDPVSKRVLVRREVYPAPLSYLPPLEYDWDFKAIPPGAVGIVQNADGSVTDTLPMGITRTFSAEEWQEKVRRGAQHLQALYFRKHARDGGTFTHPPETPPDDDDSDDDGDCTPIVVGE